MLARGPSPRNPHAPGTGERRRGDRVRHPRRALHHAGGGACRPGRARRPRPTARPGKPWLISRDW